MRDTTAQKRGVILFVIFIVMLAFAVYSAGIPRFVSNGLFDKQPYQSPSTAITAQVESDSTLVVTEKRVFDFSKKTTCVFWKHEDLTEDATISMRGLRVSILDADGNSTESIELSPVPFKAEWRDTDGFDGVGPGQPCYSIDDMNRTVYTFFEAENESVMFTLDYEITNGLTVWRDVTELEWTVLSDTWTMDSENFSVSLLLPTPPGHTVQPGTDVNAWSHGPQNGTVSISESGTVAYETPLATAGQWASLHLCFPSSWITNLPDTKIAKQHVTELHFNSVTYSEQEWVDKKNAAQTRGSQFDIIVLGLCLLVLIIGAIAFIRFGRDKKPQEMDEQELAAINPAILGRIERWNRQNDRDFAAAVVSLKQKGLIAVETLDGDDADYRLTRATEASDDAIDKATLDALFGRFANGADTVTMSEIAAFARDNKDAYCETIAGWNHELDHQVADLKLFDKKSFSWQVRLFILAALLFVIGIVAKLAAGSDVLLGASLPVACIVALLANYMPRRTQKGQDVALAAQNSGALEGDDQAMLEALAATLSNQTK